MTTNRNPALTLSDFGLLEGGDYELMVNQAVRRIMQDCRMRPYLDQARKLNLELEFTPTPSQAENARNPGTVLIEAKVKETYPARKTRGEHLDMVDDVDANGEPETKAVFAITPFFERTN